MPLSDIAIRKAKPGAKPQRIYDRDGLYLEVTPSGGKLWRQKYRFAGKEKRLAHGSYPEVSLADARERCRAARKLIAADIDPSLKKKADKAAGEDRARNSFEAIGREWLTVKAHGWVASHTEKQTLRLEKHAYPWIGKRPISDLGVADLRPLMDRIVQAGNHEQAHRVLAAISNVFRHAVATGRAERNPAADLSAALPARRKRNFASITDPTRVGDLMRAIEAYGGSAIVVAALKLAPLTFVRPGELRGAAWSEFHLDHPDGPFWAIPAARRKLLRAEKESPRTPPHIVPLAPQAVAVLKDLRPITGRSPLLFPGERNRKRSISDNTVNAALRIMGFSAEEMTGHGFRHMASTLLNELGFSPDAIERQLAHKAQGVRAVYNKAEHLPERRTMMNAWADYLDQLRFGTNDRPSGQPRLYSLNTGLAGSSPSDPAQYV